MLVTPVIKIGGEVNAELPVVAELAANAVFGGVSGAFGASGAMVVVTKLALFPVVDVVQPEGNCGA